MQWFIIFNSVSGSFTNTLLKSHTIQHVINWESSKTMCSLSRSAEAAGI